MSSRSTLGPLEHLRRRRDRGGEHQDRDRRRRARTRRTRARGVSPSRPAASSLVTSTAAAPSVICDELPAVITPSGLNAGFSAASRSGDVSGRMPSSTTSSVSASLGRPARHDLALEAAFVGGRAAAAAVRLERELVELLAGEPPLLGDQLGRDALRHEVRVPRVQRGAERVGGRGAPTSPSAPGSCSRPRRRSRRRRRPPSRPARRSAPPAATSRTAGRSRCRAPCRGTRRRARRCGRC